MCRIDAPFGERPLDEKIDPAERFLQALDECGTDGNFRALLTKHFSGNGKRVFSDVESLEKALKFAHQGTSDAEKCTAFLSSAPVIDRLSSEIDYCAINSCVGATRQNYPRLDFAIDVARKYFPKSAYGLYTSGLGDALRGSYPKFVSTFYGEDFCFSRSFFDDEALTSLGPSGRIDALLRFFDVMTQQVDGRPNTSDIHIDPLIEKLISAGSLRVFHGTPIAGPSEFLRGIEFLKAWVKYDAEAGRLGSDDETLLEKIDRHWFYDLVGSLHSTNATQQSSGKAVAAAEKWLCETRRELRTLYHRYTDLKSASDPEIDRWASGLDNLFQSYSCECLDQAIPFKNRRARTSEYLVELCAQLTPLQIETWIQWTVNKDFQGDGTARLVNGEKWWDTKHSGIYKGKLEEALARLDAEGRLRILSCRLPHSDAFYREYISWWNGLLSDLIKDDDFPTKLIPQWTIAAKESLDRELVIPYIDKSIGILRGELSKDRNPEHHKQLTELLPRLDNWHPAKALRHRLMLMRSSNIPFTDESIYRFNSCSSDNAIEWNWPMSELAKSRLGLEVNSRRNVTREEWAQVEVEILTAFSHELAEFCMSRLRLRKGEKTKDGKYDASQVIEGSPTWRQGYLKALTELGFDLNGKVHKTVYFTKQSDPDEDVRAIASECYRSVRRDSKKNRSIEDLKRGIIAAEWWLLLCQRRELGLAVNYEEALKTRRRLLRNP